MGQRWRAPPIEHLNGSRSGRIGLGAKSMLDHTGFGETVTRLSCLGRSKSSIARRWSVTGSPWRDARIRLPLKRLCRIW